MTRLSRRNFLKLAGLGAVVTGCSPIIDTGLQVANPAITAQSLSTRDRIVHLLNRATFGAIEPSVQRVNMIGIESWLNEQLDYQSIDDLEIELRLRRFDTLNMSAGDLLSFVRVPDRTAVSDQLASAMMMRAIYSKRALYEKMVHFWSDHFSIYYFKETTSNLQTIDDRDVIRPHALGYFGDLLTASAHSPAMLVYLDNVVNEKSHPNENYAREIMELHTLGVDGAYTEDDVLEVARCFTGWSVNDRGNFEFRADWHDAGEKMVLGHTIPAGGGKSDGDRVLEILIAHPDTARYVSTKLLRRFVSDEPDQTMIRDISSIWIQSDGHMPTIMRAIFAHDLFWSAPRKFKRPLEYAISVLRSVQATYDGSEALVQRLATMGQRPFGYATPDGYPDTSDEWVGSFVPRWNFAQDVANDWVDGVRIPIRQWTQFVETNGIEALGLAILQRELTTPEREALTAIQADTITQDTVRAMLAVLLSSPAFQWR